MAPRRSLTERVSDSFKVITELDLSHAYERQAGTIAIAAMAAVVITAGVATGWRLGRSGSVAVAVDFASAPGLARGDPVQFSGVPVGKVERIELREPARVRVTLGVDRGVAPRRDATAEIVALDLVGSQAVRYNPGTAAEPLEEGTVIGGRLALTLGQQLAGLRERAAEIVVGLGSFDPAAVAGDVRGARAAFVRARAAAAAFPAESLGVRLREALARVDSLAARLEALVATLPADTLRVRRDSLAGGLAALSTEVEKVQASLGRIRSGMRSGEGNLGRARRDGTLQREIEATRTSLRLLLEKYTGRRSRPR